MKKIVLLIAISIYLVGCASSRYTTSIKYTIKFSNGEYKVAEYETTGKKYHNRPYKSFKLEGGCMYLFKDKSPIYCGVESVYPWYTTLTEYTTVKTEPQKEVNY